MKTDHIMYFYYCRLLKAMSISNHACKFIDFDFVELLRFASSVLRLPRPQGERRTEHTFVRARRSQNQFTPLGVGVDKLIFKRFWSLCS